MAEDGLARFGETAVPVLTAVARAKVGPSSGGAVGDAPSDMVASALATLQKLLVSGKEIGQASRATIVSVVQARLSGSQNAEVVAAACELAGTTGDTVLLQRVARLAADRAEVRAMGISDEW